MRRQASDPGLQSVQVTPFMSVVLVLDRAVRVVRALPEEVPPWVVTRSTSGRCQGDVRRTRFRTAPTWSRRPAVFDRFVAEAAELPTEQQLVAMRQMIDQLEGLWLAAAADFSESGEIAETGHPIAGVVDAPPLQPGPG